MVQIINVLTVATAIISGASAACTCDPGHDYCGWVLLGEFGCSATDLRGTVGNSPYGQLYVCAADGSSADQLAVCPNDRCERPDNDACIGIDYCCPPTVG
ncbi:hypothetical protein F4810DRAFT_660861 [Camillea tinctor]|nr:hypothetical protein F4810DRAFT_660861 [Camillea tinctor]